jgi:nicotinamidase-related amidase
MSCSNLLHLCDADNAIVVVVDLQGKIFNLIHNGAQLASTVPRLMKITDLFRVPLILTEQYPKGLGPTNSDIKNIYHSLCTEKHLVEKESFGCCGEPEFTTLLYKLALRLQSKREGKDPSQPIDIIIAGIETHICIQQTVLALMNGGYRVVVLQDCTGSRLEDYHHCALKRFRRAGAVISNLESLAFEWAKTKGHPCFKKMSALIKEGAHP